MKAADSRTRQQDEAFGCSYHRANKRALIGARTRAAAVKLAPRPSAWQPPPDTSAQVKEGGSQSGSSFRITWDLNVGVRRVFVPGSHRFCFFFPSQVGSDTNA